MSKKELLEYFDYIKSKADIARTHSLGHDQVFNYYCRKIRKIIECYYETEWIPFMFDEDGMLNCPLPDEEEEILISDGTSVWVDTLMTDVEDGNTVCYLDNSNCDLRGLAWMPLPEAHIKEMIK